MTYQLWISVKMCTGDMPIDGFAEVQHFHSTDEGLGPPVAFAKIIIYIVQIQTWTIFFDLFPIVLMNLVLSPIILSSDKY